jgi:hypothetical protein
MPTLQIFARLRDHVANVDRLARLGIWHQAGGSLLVLQVEDLGQRLGRASQRGVLYRRSDLVAADPDLASIDKPVQKLFASACCHAVRSRLLIVLLRMQD